MLLPNDEQDAALIEIDGSNAGRSAWSAWSAVSSMCDVAPSNHAGGGRGTPGEGKESATEDDDREERGGKFLEKWNTAWRNPGVRYHSRPNQIVLYCRVHSQTTVRYP